MDIRRLLGLSVLLSACLLSAAATLAQNVIVVVVDGGRYSETFGAGSANFPLLWNELRPQGTIWTDFRNEGLTKTNPGHASIETGTWEQIDNGGGERPASPTIFEYFRKQTGAPDSSVYVVAGKQKLGILTYSTHPGYGAPRGALFEYDSGNGAIAGRVMSILQNRHPRILVVNFPDADIRAHAADSLGYVRALTEADLYVFQIWRRIQTDPFYRGTTTLFVTNDHGRHTSDYTGHGDDCDGCRHIMLFAGGRGIAKGRTVSRRREQIDIATTISDLMGFPVPFSTGSSLLADTVSRN